MWRIAFTEWDLVTEPDLHQWYTLDMSAPGAWARPWSALAGRILGLLDIPDSRLTRRVRALHDDRSDEATAAS